MAMEVIVLKVESDAEAEMRAKKGAIHKGRCLREGRGVGVGGGIGKGGGG